MVDEPPDDALIVATEKSRAVRGMGLFALIGAFFASLPLWHVPSRDSVPNAVLFGLLWTLLGGLCVIFMPLAKWRIDAEGIEYRPSVRRRRYLRWQDVNRVKWNATQGVFCGNRVKIRLVWLVLPKEQQQAAKERVQKLLSPHFDLSPGPGPAMWMVWVNLVLFIGAIVIAPMLAYVTFPVVLGGQTLPWVPAFAQGAVLVAGIELCLFWGWFVSWQTKMAHPIWRERRPWRSPE